MNFNNKKVAVVGLLVPLWQLATLQPGEAFDAAIGYQTTSNPSTPLQANAIQPENQVRNDLSSATFIDSSPQPPNNIGTDTDSTLPAAGNLPSSNLDGQVLVSNHAKLAQLDQPLGSEPIANLSQQIALKELELLRLNTHFRLETTEQSRIKPWRTFLYNIAGSSVATGGIVTVAAERWRTWQRPGTAHRSTLKAGPLQLLISHSIITGGVLLEGALDLWSDHKIKRRGHNPELTLKRVLALKSDIDHLLAERETLVQQYDHGNALEIAEGKVLKDIHNLSLLQYSQFYARAHRRKWVRNFQFFNQLSAATTGGYLGSLCGLLAVVERRPQLAGPAGIGFTISGANIALGPIMGRLVGNLGAKTAGKRVNRMLGELSNKTVADLDKDLNELQRQASASTPNAQMVNRLAVYSAEKNIFETQAKMNAAEKKRANKELLERMVVNSIVGGTKMGWGIQLSNAGYGYARRLPTPTIRVPVTVGGVTARVALPALKNENNLFAHRVAQGATTYIPGTSVWILDTLQSRARGEMEVFSMGSQMALPHQKLKTRIEQLEKLESTLKNTTPSL